MVGECYIKSRQYWSIFSHFQDLKAETERIQRELNELYEQLDEAEAEYEYVKEVLEDPGFKMRKLQREISLLEEISDKLRQQNLDS